MLRVVRTLAVMIVLIPILVGSLLPGMALAHERRKVGKYELVVGFIEEPALLGQPNGISLVVNNTETNQPVEGLQQTLEAEVAYGGKTMPVVLQPRFRTPGNYTAQFIPTRPGTYIFRFFGEIEGLKVDERFQSGPGTFNNVEPVAGLQFPDKLPDSSEAAARLQNAESSAQGAWIMAGVLGGAGVVLGAAGLAFGLASLRAQRGGKPQPGARGAKGGQRSPGPRR